MADPAQLLMQLINIGLRNQFPQLALSLDQCVCIVELAVQAIQSDPGARKMLTDIMKRRGEKMAGSAVFQLGTMSAFCFIWFFVRNEHVSARVYGRTHARFSLLGRSLNKPFSELEVSQQNLLKHIVMAVRRSGQWRRVSAPQMQTYLRARAFNLVTLTAKVAAIKRMDLHEFALWAQSIQFSDYLTNAIGENMMLEVRFGRQD